MSFFNKILFKNVLKKPKKTIVSDFQYFSLMYDPGKKKPCVSVENEQLLLIVPYTEKNHILSFITLSPSNKTRRTTRLSFYGVIYALLPSVGNNDDSPNKDDLTSEPNNYCLSSLIKYFFVEDLYVYAQSIPVVVCYTGLVKLP